MRNDVKERMKQLRKEHDQNGIKPNFSKIAKSLNCDYRTAKKWYEDTNADTSTKVKESKPKLLDGFEEIIRTKYDDGCFIDSIFKFIQKKGYKGGYTTVRNFCNQYKREQVQAATIRFETNPGLQAQVDWKESFTLTSKHSELIRFNLFLVILGYSRKKFVMLTLDKNQDTVFYGLIESFKYFGGIPNEILFDNMKTVVDRSKTEFKAAVINQKFNQFSKDMGFKVLTCRPYKPQTKGKVEALAKLTNRLRVYNNEFESIEELNEIVIEFNNEINDEIVSTTGKTPNQLTKKEKEYLNNLPSNDYLESYLKVPTTRKVTKESMITYKLSKYSVPVKYVNKTVDLEVNSNELYIYYNKSLIRKHQLCENYFNYHLDDQKEILKSGVFKNESDEYIESFIENNLKLYDDL